MDKKEELKQACWAFIEFVQEEHKAVTVAIVFERADDKHKKRPVTAFLKGMSDDILLMLDSAKEGLRDDIKYRYVLKADDKPNNKCDGNNV